MTVLTSCAVAVLLVIGAYAWALWPRRRAQRDQVVGVTPPRASTEAEVLLGPPDGQGLHIIARVVESIDADADKAGPHPYRDPWADRAALVCEVVDLLPVLERLAAAADADDAAALRRAHDMLMEYANGVGGGGLIPVSAHMAEIQAIWASTLPRAPGAPP